MSCHGDSKDGSESDMNTKAVLLVLTAASHLQKGTEETELDDLLCKAMR